MAQSRSRPAGQARGKRARRDNERWVEWFGRAGLLAQGLLYVLVAMLALQVALGHRSQETDTRGALREVAGHTGGAVLLTALAVGFAGYGLWRFAEAVVGHRDERDERKRAVKRAASAGLGLVYVGLCATTVKLLAGRAVRGADAEQTWTARVLRAPFGRALVVLVGLAFVAAGAVLVWRGATRSFAEHLAVAQIPAPERPWALRLGVLGNVARGGVAALAGTFLVRAAVAFDPAKAHGLDGTLRELAARPYGGWLLAIVAAGLLAFGVYTGAIEARYRRLGS